MRGSLSVAALGLATILLLGSAPAAAQQGPPGGDATGRLQEIGRQLEDLTGHVEQMRGAVRDDPSLAGRMGSPGELDRVVSTGRLLLSAAMQLEATSRQIGGSLEAGGDSLDGPVREGYRRLRASMAGMVDAMGGLVARYDSLRKALHEQGGG